MAERLPDWEARLSAYLAARRKQPFAWGSHDCALFACGAVEAMTGAHPAPEFLDAYSDRIGAAKALRDFGAGTLDATFDLHFTRCPVGFAKRGDLVMVDGSMGVCMGAYGLFVGEDHAPDAPLPEGLVKLPRALFATAWSV